MKTRLYILVTVLTLPGVAALAEVAVPAQPPAFAECKDEYPSSIVGTWRSDPVWTREEQIRRNPEAATGTTNTAADGGVAASATIQFTDTAFITDQLTREYTVIAGNAQLYILELRDDHGATHPVRVELVTCGIVIESNTACEGAFCANAIDDLFKRIMQQTGETIDAAKVEALKKQALESLAEQSRQPVRTYYRAVAEN